MGSLVSEDALKGWQSSTSIMQKALAPPCCQPVSLQHNPSVCLQGRFCTFPGVMGRDWLKVTGVQEGKAEESSGFPLLFGLSSPSCLIHTGWGVRSCIHSWLAPAPQ